MYYAGLQEPFYYLLIVNFHRGAQMSWKVVRLAFYYLLIVNALLRKVEYLYLAFTFYYLLIVNAGAAERSRGWRRSRLSIIFWLLIPLRYFLGAVAVFPTFYYLLIVNIPSLFFYRIHYRVSFYYLLIVNQQTFI